MGKPAFRIKGGGQLYLAATQNSAIDRAHIMTATYECRFWVLKESVGVIYIAFPADWKRYNYSKKAV